MLSDRLALIKAHKSFYRVRYDRASKLLWIFIAIIIVLLLILMALFVTRPSADYYASSMDGTLIRLRPLEVPNARPFSRAL